MSSDAYGKLSGKRLVIFGCGYVGSALAEQALSRGVRVTALTRNDEKAAVLRASGVEVVVADLAESAWHGRIEGGADWVVNCVSSGGGGLGGYRHSYVAGMESVRAWASAGGPVGTMVYTGSTSVYPQDGGVRIKEEATTDGAGERARVLLAAEDIVKSGQGAWSRWFVLRLAGIYGPGRHHLLEQVRSGEASGKGDVHLNLVFRDDIVAAIWAVLLAKPEVANEVFNVADDGAATKAEIVAWLAQRLGVTVPRFSGEPAAGRREVTPDRVIDNAKIKRVLGWRPAMQSFREGYEKILSR